MLVSAAICLHSKPLDIQRAKKQNAFLRASLIRLCQVSASFSLCKPCPLIRTVDVFLFVNAMNTSLPFLYQEYQNLCQEYLSLPVYVQSQSPKYSKVEFTQVFYIVTVEVNVWR